MILVRVKNIFLSCSCITLLLLVSTFGAMWCGFRFTQCLLLFEVTNMVCLCCRGYQFLPSFVMTLCFAFLMWLRLTGHCFALLMWLGRTGRCFVFLMWLGRTGSCFAVLKLFPMNPCFESLKKTHNPSQIHDGQPCC